MQPRVAVYIYVNMELILIPVPGLVLGACRRRERCQESLMAPPARLRRNYMPSITDQSYRELEGELSSAG